MKNKLISILFILLIILLIVALFRGIKIGGFQILSVAELKNKNGQLEEKIETASILTTVDYPNNISTLEGTYDQFKIQKQKYEEISGFTGEDKKQVYETKQYDIGYLWKTVGKYGTSYNLTIGMDVRKTTGQNLYDLYFSVSGEYVNISEFITNIENNSDLNFRIYNFKMSGSSETVSASFTVKDVNIDPSTITNSSVTNTNPDENNASESVDEQNLETETDQ